MGRLRLCSVRLVSPVLLGQPAWVAVQIFAKLGSGTGIYQQQAVGCGAQQVTVVRYNHHGTVISLQCQTQAMAHLQVKMVCRLVQQQQIGPLINQQCQYQPRLLAAGKGGYLTLCQLSRKTESTDIVAQLLLARFRIEYHKMLNWRLIRAQLIELVLRKVADFQLLRALPLAAEGCQFSCKQFDQGRFSGTVGSEQANPVARRERQIQSVQNSGLAITGTCLLQAQ